MPFEARLAYLVRIGEARDYDDALRQVNARRRAWIGKGRERAAASESERRARADRMAAIFAR